MVGWTNTEETNILNFWFGGAVLTPDTTMYLALLTASLDDGTYTEVTAAQWDTYARQAVNMNSTDWNIPVGGDPSYISNKVAHTFLEMTAGTGVTVSRWGLFDAQSIASGTMKFHGTIVTPLQVNAGVQPQFNAGALFGRLGDLTP